MKFKNVIAFNEFSEYFIGKCNYISKCLLAKYRLCSPLLSFILPHSYSGKLTNNNGDNDDNDDSKTTTKESCQNF